MPEVASIPRADGLGAGRRPANPHRASGLAEAPARTRPLHRASRSPVKHIAAVIAVAAGLAGASTGTIADDTHAEDQRIAGSLAALLRAGRAVISQSQAVINDPGEGPKGLDGDAVLSRAVAIYQKATGVDPSTIAPTSREGRLLGYEMEAIKAVMDANQGTINAPGTGFKGFIPAVFSRLVGEAFSKRAAGEAQLKVTAPPNLVRNRKARPDPWEAEVIKTEFLSAGWPVGQSFEATTMQDGHPIFRIAVPEYYGASCLSCHGAPKGELDITGYPKEGASVGDLGGVISIKLGQR